MKKTIISALMVLGMAVSASSAMAGEIINGAGATFPAPAYTKWFYAYEKETGVKINYQAIGSGGGIKQVSEGTVDFGASDAPLKGKDQDAKKLVMVPTVAGAVAVVYNLPGVESLNLPTSVIVDIFMGKITKWNDKAIAAANPGVNLPDKAIIVAHRADGSGTTNIFTSYLSIDQDWKDYIGAGTTVQWPVGLGGKGNEGVAGIVRGKAGSIGYVEVAYANQNKMQIAAVGNKTGKFIFPTQEGVKAAMDTAKIPDDFNVMIVNAPGNDAYPISGFTFLLLRKDYAKTPEVVKFVEWAYKNGDAAASSLEYVPLSDVVKAKALAKIK